MSNNSNIETCGLIIGAFKPFTKGHHFLFEVAAIENDHVLVSVSQKDRKRKGEHPIEWEKMKIVWDEYIVGKLPKNITVISAESPIQGLYNFLKMNDDKPEGANVVFTLYMDDKDLKRYCYQDHELKNKFPNLYNRNQIKVKTFNRESNVNVSATKMRKTLQDNDLQGFTECLPDVLKDQASEIFTLLS